MLLMNFRRENWRPHQAIHQRVLGQHEAHGGSQTASSAPPDHRSLVACVLIVVEDREDSDNAGLLLNPSSNVLCYHVAKEFEVSNSCETFHCVCFNSI